jgi:integrase
VLERREDSMGRPNAQGLPQYLRRRPDGTYFLDYYISKEDGSRVRRLEVIGKVPKAVAIKCWQAKISDLAMGRLSRRRIKFGEAADAFLEYSKSRKRSWVHDAQLVAKLKNHFGDTYLDAFNSDSVERFLNVLRKQGKKMPLREGKSPEYRPFKPATLNRYIACLKTIVNRAIGNNLLDRNPIKGVKLFKENNVRDRVLTQSEYEALLAQCAPHLKPMVVLAYMTGMRRGEIIRLRWNQLNLAGKIIGLSPDDTKTNEAREIPLDDELVEILRKVPRLLGCPFVFTHNRKPLKEVKGSFDRACAKAGIKNFRFHDLRHCAVTNLSKAGVREKVIMSISGHKTSHMLRRYDSVDQDDRTQALSKVREFLDNRARAKLKIA